MSGKNDMWRAMRGTVKRWLRNDGPMAWEDIEESVYQIYGVEPDEDFVMGPEMDNNGVRFEEGKYLAVGD